MPIFEIETPDGVFEVDAPDEQTALGALGGQAPAPQSTALPQSGAAREFADFASGATQNPARAQYDELPAWQKPIVAGSDILQLAGRAPLMGWGEKAVAGLRAPFTGNSYEDELADQRRQTTAARNRSGWAGTAAEVGGAVAGPMALAGKGVTLAGRGGTATMEGVKGLAARSGLMAAEGAGYGAINAAGEDQDILSGAGLGALFGAGGNILGEGLSKGVDKVAGLFNKKPPVQTIDDLKAAGKAAFKEADAEGVVFNQNGVQRLGQGIIDDLTEHGFDPVNEPGLMPVVNRLKKMGETGNVTLTGLHSLRKVASNGFVPGNKSNNKLVSQVIARIDDLVQKADPDTILVAGDPRKAATSFRKGLDMWNRARKVETVEDLVAQGGRIGRTNKSQNVEQATKRQLRKILDSKSVGRGFTAAEKAAADKAIGYTVPQQALDAISGMLPRGQLTGMVQGSIGAANMATGNLPGLALQGAGMLAGYGAKKGSEALARKSVDQFVDLVARGGVPAQTAPNAVQLLARQKRDALGRALMALGVYNTTD